MACIWPYAGQKSGLKRVGKCDIFEKLARVVEWHTRTTQNRVPQGLWVQVPPRAPVVTCSELRIWSDFAEAKIAL